MKKKFKIKFRSKNLYLEWLMSYTQSFYLWYPIQANLVWPHSPFELHYLNFKYCGQRVNKLSGNNTEKPTPSPKPWRCYKGPGEPFSFCTLCFEDCEETRRTFHHRLQTAEAEFLDETQPKVLRVFLLAIHSRLYSFALRFLFLQTHATSYGFYSSVTVLCKGERRKTW